MLAQSALLLGLRTLPFFSVVGWPCLMNARLVFRCEGMEMHFRQMLSKVEDVEAPIMSFFAEPCFLWVGRAQ